MTPVWITRSDLGYFAQNHDFAESPLTLQYSASINASAELVSGELPAGITAVYYPNNVRLIGAAEPNTGSKTYAVTFKINEPWGESVERQFYFELIDNPIPVWLSQSRLPTQSESYSYTLYPFVLEFNADPAATVVLLNGSLPNGLTWNKLVETNTLSKIIIKGESTNLSVITDFEWTFRVTNPNNTIADRTFYLTLVPLAEYPDWTGQASFLGYGASSTTVSFRLSAKQQQKRPITYSFVGPIPAGMRLNSVNGLLTWNVPETLTNINLEFTVRASTPFAYTDVDLTATGLYKPQAPLWVTQEVLQYIPQGSYLQYPIVAFDAAGDEIAYIITSSTTGFPFILDEQGLLYGEAPTVAADTLYTCVVTATSVNGFTVREFSFKVTKVNQAGVLEWNNDVTEFLALPDGELTVLDIGAKSTRKPTVLHGIVGGQLPPGLVLDKVQGKLVGFLDYHAVDKDYWAELIATDDIDILTKKIHIHVKSRYGYQFASLSIPLTGDVKQLWISTVQFCVTAPNSIPNVQVLGNTLWYPSVSIVKGLNSCIRNPNEILNSIANAEVFGEGLNYTSPLIKLELAVGSDQTTSIDGNGNTLLYRQVVDPQSGAGFTANTQSETPSSIVPPSLNNIRQAFIETCGLANSGTGSGATAVPIINMEDGSLSKVSVVTPGSGYTSHPSVVVKGSGVNAECSAIMKLVGLDIIDPGSNWIVGEYITLNLGNYIDPAVLVVTAVDNNGGLLDFYILNGGYYVEMPIGKLWIKNSAGIITGINPDLGVGKIQVLSGGMGYDQVSTSISFEGTEILEDWQATYEPYIPIAMITQPYANTIVNNSHLSVTQLLDGARWQVGDFIWSVEGVYWEGSSSFDDEWTTFDGNSTCFEETLEPSETIFDTTYNTYDLYKTYFDANDRLVKDSHANWGATGFDEWTTAFEFYATIFDAIEPPRESRTVIKKLISLQHPQWSGENRTDWSIT